MILNNLWRSLVIFGGLCPPLPFVSNCQQFVTSFPSFVSNVRIWLPSLSPDFFFKAFGLTPFVNIVICLTKVLVIAILGDLLQFSAIFGYLRRSSLIIRDLWRSLAIFGNLWQSLVIFGDLWHSHLATDGIRKNNFSKLPHQSHLLGQYGKIYSQ